jgi:glycosyltransferase involved in cell wall biosynthesis
VKGALTQTYVPLEIILSDDCSSDRTFQIMEELVKNYSGSSTVVLNRNPVNLGIGNHINRVMEMAKGEYIVAAAGDDISIPERTVKLIDAFAENTSCVAVFSEHTEIDENGNSTLTESAQPPDGFSELKVMCRRQFYGVAGATNSWHRKVFDIFGPLRNGIVFEDRVISFRAALLGGICFLEQPLVLYRRHTGNTIAMFSSKCNRDLLKLVNNLREVYLNNICDLEFYYSNGNLDENTYKSCKRIMEFELSKLNGKVKLISGTFLDKIFGFIQVIVSGGNPAYILKQILTNIK